MRTQDARRSQCPRRLTGCTRRGRGHVRAWAEPRGRFGIFGASWLRARSRAVPLLGGCFVPVSRGLRCPTPACLASARSPAASADPEPRISLLRPAQPPQVSPHPGEVSRPRRSSAWRPGPRSCRAAPRDGPLASSQCPVGPLQQPHPSLCVTGPAGLGMTPGQHCRPRPAYSRGPLSQHCLSFPAALWEDLSHPRVTACLRNCLSEFPLAHRAKSAAALHGRNSQSNARWWSTDVSSSVRG